MLEPPEAKDLKVLLDKEENRDLQVHQDSQGREENQVFLDQVDQWDHKDPRDRGGTLDLLDSPDH
jgi:hypothetical protein